MQLRHPHILTFKDTVEVEEKGETAIYLMTEAVSPLAAVLRDIRGPERCGLLQPWRWYSGGGQLALAPCCCLCNCSGGSSCVQVAWRHRRRCGTPLQGVLVKGARLVRLQGAVHGDGRASHCQRHLLPQQRLQAGAASLRESGALKPHHCAVLCAPCCASSASRCILSCIFHAAGTLARPAGTHAQLYMACHADTRQPVHGVGGGD